MQKTIRDDPLKSKEQKENFKQEHKPEHKLEHKARDNKNKDNKSILIRFDESQITRLTEARLPPDEGSINGKILTATPQHINKILKIALNSNKDLHFGKVSKITDDNVDLILSNNSICQIKPNTELVPDQYVAISKGKFGRCSLVTVLDKAD